MTSPSPLRRLLVEAVDDPPASSVTAADTYRRGRRHRRLVRSGSACGIAVALLAAGAAALPLVQHPDAPSAAARPRIALDPLPQTPGGCAALAAAVRTVAEAALPADIEWTDTSLAATDDNCVGGGLFWLSFSYRGRDDRLGFEGGQTASGDACDESRGVTTCQETDGVRIGHYAATDDYGVLLDRTGTFFFLGLDDGRNPPLTTDQLEMTAKEIARVVYPR